MKKVALLLVCLISAGIFAGSVCAQSTKIETGLTWMSNLQNQTGSWGNSDSSLNPLTMRTI